MSVVCIDMRYCLEAVQIITTVGPPVLAFSCSGWQLSHPLTWFFYSLLPPLAVAGMLGAWARILFWSMAHVGEIKRMGTVILGRWQRIAAEVSGRILSFVVILWIVAGICRRIRVAVVPAFRFQIRDLLWLMLVAAVTTQWWVERRLLQGRVASLEGSDAVVRSLKQSLCVDDAGLDIYIGRLKKLPRAPTNVRVGPMTPIFIGPPMIIRPNSAIPPTPKANNSRATLEL